VAYIRAPSAGASVHYIVTLHDDDTRERIALGLDAPDQQVAIRRARARARCCRHVHISVLGVVIERVV
jgi:hypothetical protein